MKLIRGNVLIDEYIYLPDAESVLTSLSGAGVVSMSSISITSTWQGSVLASKMLLAMMVLRK